MAFFFVTSSIRSCRTSRESSFTTVAAAERFVRMRMAGKQKDLMGLVEFGNQAYVVTPFTSDYDNILLSLSLIGDFGEFLRFPDQGTMIARAIEQYYGHDFSIDGILHEIETGEVDYQSLQASGDAYSQPVVRLIAALLADAVERKGGVIHEQTAARPPTTRRSRPSGSNSFTSSIGASGSAARP